MKPVLETGVSNLGKTTCVDGGGPVSVSVEVDACAELTPCEAGNVLEDPSMHSKGIDLDSDCSHKHKSQQQRRFYKNF